MKIYIFVLVAIVTISIQIMSQTIDTGKVFYTNEITVFGNSQEISKTDFPMGKSNLHSVLAQGGFSLIRKGVFFAQDLYADGLKRGDYTVTIDGERYHNACPMRMDAPITRINPLEVSSITMIKSSDELQSGLGGVIALHRAKPQDSLHAIGTIAQSAGNLSETDIAFLSEFSSHRLSARYTTGKSYTAGNGKTFKDLYGYKDETQYQFAEAAFTGSSHGFLYTASFMYTGDVLFPYQQMDEKMSSVYNASIMWKDIKLYANYTSHVMNNSLRVSSMLMETDAKNTTFGVTGKWFEFYYRGWSADNFLSMTSMGNTMRIDNHILPNISQFSANFSHKLTTSLADLSARVGSVYYDIGDKTVENFYKTVHGKSENTRIFITGGLAASKKISLPDSWEWFNNADIVSETPEAEALFIKVQRFTGKPYWSGNPNLRQPIRGTIRSKLMNDLVSIEGFASYVNDYVYPTGKTIGTQKYQTFTNINALLCGVTLKAQITFIESELTYLYGENKSNNKPLVEILPLQLKNKISLPEFSHMQFYLLHTYENAMKRIDRSLLELPSQAWNAIDAGVRATLLTNLILHVEVENILNHTFARHLSYVRDPFASGFTVLEPGTTFRVNIRYIY